LVFAHPQKDALGLWGRLFWLNVSALAANVTPEIVDSSALAFPCLRDVAFWLP